ncbi:molybdenum cofactor biosynthesis protein MoaE [Curvivirga aplysinae]|uniref:molybdenum cofactor biosynthesis protein MoaE n=1 Tax=Curvivirga aplysinae TaxID=2529852 RepID=UPI0012BBA61D|nr:molybdenum cofactor biosynthesis protein MoaE [Curvivirga aplysinae]MTI10219.1 molybdenum cofactor biosynthesis protein MoaE [Curvivirga aplysinae]
MAVRVQVEDFDLGMELKQLTDGNHAIGGLCSFVGLVRDMTKTDDGEMTRSAAMTLEHYPGMTEKMLERIETEAHERWPLESSLIIHRYGRMDAGEQIVLVAASSAHREAAFEACHFLIDWLKTKAPFWKVEEDESGKENWVEARDSDDQATERWNKN